MSRSGGKSLRYLGSFRLFAVIALGAVLACGAEPERRPTLLLAIDGLEWEVLRPLIESGELPHFERLLRTGVAGRLATSKPTFSPIIWTSIATGKSRADHGIRGFVKRQTGTGRLYRSFDRKSKAFWNILSEHDRSVAVVGWWMTFPVEPVEGVMVAQVNTLDQTHRARGKAILKGSLKKDLPGQVFPPGRTNEILEIHAEVEAGLSERLDSIFGHRPEVLSPLAERLWLNTQWAFRADAAYLEITKVIAGEDFDVVACYFGGADVAGHRFWRYFQPEAFVDKPADEALPWLAGIIPAYYRFLDNALGELRAAMQDATVIVVSDHGMRPTNEDRFFEGNGIPSDINSGHHKDAPPGVFIAGGLTEDVRDLNPGEWQTRLGSIYDILPTLLALQDVPIARDLKGEVIEAVATDRGKRVDTFDTPEWLASRGQREFETAEEEQRLEQLRALGYIN